ncbi:MAG: CRISPR-associated Csh1 family protein [Acetothermia bacterium 64_32]|nr:MAG: CRISPR-associated Csh1 family protein [Acetothermia bacterium 64_32]MBC7098605.1 hypothetical protein [Candidatus Bipolaricaulota bacterium]HAF69774.1 hypothetical protein [Candidatus Acetothermia bacterium]
MLEGLRTLGHVALDWRRQHAASEEEALLHALVSTDALRRYTHLVILPLRHENGTWRLAQPKLQELDEKTLYQALWLEHAPRNVAQDRLTVARLEYLISQAIPALTCHLGPGLPQGDLRDHLEALLQSPAYLELPVQKATDQRYRWVWNLSTLGWARWEWVPKGRRKALEDLARALGTDALTPELWQAFAQQAGAKAAVPLIAATLEAGLRNALGLKGEKVLFTLEVEGQWLVRHLDYHRYLVHFFLDNLFEGAQEGTCHVCGRSGVPVTDDTVRLRLKLYITDKPGFASGFVKEHFHRNYALCQECYQHLLAGEAFLRTRLRSRLVSTVYVLPTFHLPEVRPMGQDLEAWSQYISALWNATLNLEGWRAFQEQLEAYREYENRKASFLLDFLFVEDDGRSVKLQRHIRDVPPSRLDEMDRARRRTRAFAEEHLVPFRTERWDPWDLSLQAMSSLFPMGIKGSGRVAFFGFLEALLTDKPLSQAGLIRAFLEVASMHHFERYRAYGRTPSNNPALNLQTFLVQTQLLWYYLAQLGLKLITGGEPMGTFPLADQVRNLIPSDVWAYMEHLGLSLPQRALFLLGILIGQVAQVQTGQWPKPSAQSKDEQTQIEKYKSEKNGTAKSSTKKEYKPPVLNKIQFHGMDVSKIHRLSNQVFNEMQIYKVNRYREPRDLYAAMHALLDAAGNLVSPAENTYWVLSGYAFQHLRRFGKTSPDESVQDKTK